MSLVVVVCFLLSSCKCVVMGWRWLSSFKKIFSSVLLLQEEITFLLLLPRKKKVLRYSGQTTKSQAPKTPRTDTILPKHLLAHTLITYVYSHYCIWSFCHHMWCKNDVLITSTRIEFSNHENIAVAYTNFLSIASCRIVNVRYRNDLLVTEIRVVVSPVVYKQCFYENDVQSCDKQSSSSTLLK